MNWPQVLTAVADGKAFTVWSAAGRPKGPQRKADPTPRHLLTVHLIGRPRLLLEPLETANDTEGEWETLVKEREQTASLITVLLRTYTVMGPLDDSRYVQKSYAKCRSQ